MLKGVKDKRKDIKICYNCCINIIDENKQGTQRIRLSEVSKWF